jgi:hypothetical protein
MLSSPEQAVNVYLERQRLVLVPVMLLIMDLHVQEFVD